MEELAKTYNPTLIEKDIYEWWESEGYFRPEKQRELGLVDDSSPRYCITMPPPNVTGVLHLGHAITLAIEDLMTRVERMKQKETLYLPGMDHAGIATQNVVERELKKQNTGRKEMGREKFVERVWEWKDKYHKRITEQTKLLGVSCDWTRERFTLDSQLSAAVRKAFVTLYKRDLIYKGQYMVNWCPGACESAISDLEAEPLELKSHLWYIKYPVKSDGFMKPQAEWGSGKWAEGATDFIELATTRPETIMGDTGVAIAVNHEKYKKYNGKTAILPVLGREIPIFEDKYVDPFFGTGALKITPAHDPNDYEIGEKHNLEAITILDDRAKIIKEYGGKYAGMDRYDCRKALVEDLEKEGLLIKIENYVHTVAHCQRCHTIIEPKISTQWFVRTQTLAQKAMMNVMKEETVMFPEREEKRFYRWMEKIRDWCISRQLWWGHRIPVWYCSNGHKICEMEDPTECPECKDKNIIQDEDVLDTWFSSGLWPFSTLGWPNEDASDYKRFFPTDMRETGYDILFFWVAREMMLSNELTGQKPYSDVYFHGIIRNEKGKKISKSMTDVAQYDPKLIIKEFGADALRYTLISNCIPGKDINLNPKNVESARKFCNKIWQSTKYVLGNLEDMDSIPKFSPEMSELLTQGDKWILSRLNRLIQKTNKSIESYDYLNYARDFHSFYWNEFCDWYIEMTKIRLYDEQEEHKKVPKSILLHILDTCFRLLHPIMPYITEKLWQQLPKQIREVPALIVANWPQVNEHLIIGEIESNFNIIIEFIRGIRRTRTNFNITPGLKVPLKIVTEKKVEMFSNYKKEIVDLAKIDPEKIEILTNLEAVKFAGRVVAEDTVAYIPLDGLIDIAEEKEKFTKQKTKAEKMVEKIKKKLNSAFAERAAPELVEDERQKLIGYEDKVNALNENIKILESK
jgi:valyl-tRNA synthetase